MILVAGSAKILFVEEKRFVPIVHFYVEFRTDDVIDIDAGSSPDAQNGDPAQWIPRQHSPPRSVAPSPGPAIVKRFKPRAAPCRIPIARVSQLPVILAMRHTIAVAIGHQRATLGANSRRFRQPLFRHRGHFGRDLHKVKAAALQWNQAKLEAGEELF